MKEDFEKNYSDLQIEEISPEKFFALRMHNRITKMAEFNFYIVKANVEYVFIAKTLTKEGQGVFYSNILKCRRKILEEQFPDYFIIDGMLARSKIVKIMKPYKPDYNSNLKNDIELVPELAKDKYIFHYKWNYSADNGPLIKRNFNITISKKNLEDIKVIQTYP